MPIEPDDSLGYERVTVGTAVKSLTVPTGAGAAIFQAETADVRWRTDPSAGSVAAGTGLVLAAGATMVQSGAALSAFRAVRSGTVDATLHVLYYES